MHHPRASGSTAKGPGILEVSAGSRDVSYTFGTERFLERRSALGFQNPLWEQSRNWIIKSPLQD